MIKNIKIWIGKDNPTYSKKVQEYLFSQGVLWIHNGDKVVRHTNTNYIVVGEMHRLWCGGNRGATPFEMVDCKEMKLIETVTYTLEAVREKICIGEKSYYIDELEVALKNIKPIENV